MPPLRTLALLSAGCLWACGGAPKTGDPANALRAYAAAIEADDAEAVRAVLSEEARAETSAERLSELMSENRAELREQARDLEQLPEEGLTTSARLRLRGGHPVTLVQEDGHWAIDGGVLTAPTLRTPLDAVGALRQALSRRSLAGILRILSRASLADVETEITELLGDTEDELALEVEIQGRNAIVRTVSGREIHLVRESNEWRISDLQ